MTGRIKRRYVLGAGSVVVFSSILYLWQFGNINRLVDTSIVTGSLLLSMIALLALFNLRKRFSFLPIGSAASWLQIHVYVGYMVIFLFIAHAGWRWPGGTIAMILMLLFILVALSGVVGLMMSKMIPARLTARGVNVDFEQILALRRKVKLEAEQMAVESIKRTSKSTIADFYADRLEIFFIRSHFFFLAHFLGSTRHIEPIQTQIHALRRYLDDDENAIMDRLASCIIEKDNLDFQYTWQWFLRAWLFVHIPLSLGLLVLGSFHGLLAYQFLGG